MSVDKTKVTAGVLGVAATAAVAAGSLPGAAQDLQTAIQNLFAKSAERGIELPADPGIRHVTDGMQVMSPTTGEVMTLEVAQGEEIDRGDRLTLCHQYEQGEDIPLGDHQLLAADVAEYEGQTYCVIVCNGASSGGTEMSYLFTLLLHEDGSVDVGEMVLLESYHLSEADVAILPATGLAVAIYPRDNMGWTRWVQLGRDGALTKLGSDSVFEDGAPYNLHVDGDDWTDLCYSCVRTVDGKTTVSVRPGTDLVTERNIGLAPIVDLVGLTDFDAAFAPDSWDLAWCDGTIDPQDVDGSYDDLALYLSYPLADGTGNGVAAVKIDTATKELALAGTTRRVAPGKVSGATSVEARKMTDRLATVVTTGKSEAAGKVWATLEVYATEEGDNKASCAFAVPTQPVRGTDITQVCQAQGVPGYLGMVVNKTLYITALEPGASAIGPTQRVVSGVDAATILPVGESTVFALYESAGNLYLQPMTVEKVVRKAESGDPADGSAIDGAKAGELCKATIWRSLDDAYFAPGTQESET